MSQQSPTRHVTPRLEILERREVLSSSIGFTEAFDTTEAGALPSGWSQWSSTGAQAFAVAADRSVSPDHSLAVRAAVSGLAARSWLDAEQPADARVNASVYVDSLIPARVFLRGSSLDTATPTYYAASIKRGLQVQLLAVNGGTTTVLGQVSSASWFEAKWARVSLQATGNALRIQIQRLDDGRFLDASGQWQTASAYALNVTDGTITGGGRMGVERPASYTGSVFIDDFRHEAAITEAFDTTAAGALPSGWSQWSSTGAPAFAVAADRSVSPDHSLAVRAPGAAGLAARTWLDVEPADAQLSASVYLDSLIPAQLFVRGSSLDTATPTYYAASIKRGLQVQLLAVNGGTTTVLGQVSSASWFDAKWARVSLYASGDNLRVQVQRLDDGRFLAASGQWQSAPTWAITVSDGSIFAAGKVGLARPASFTGSVYFDDFRVGDVGDDRQAPTVIIQSPTATAPLSGTVRVWAAAKDNVGVTRVEYFVDGVLRHWEAVLTGWDFDTTTASNGSHVLTVLAYDATGNVGQASLTILTKNDVTPPSIPDIPRHYSHVRLAQLAYGSIGPVEQHQLRNSIDLVIVDVPTKNRPQQIEAVAPNTPQLLYANLSNVYTSSLTDWMQYADARGLSRESAFYHASRPTAYAGAGGSTQPVNWFWRVYRRGTGTTDLTTNARGSSAAGVGFPQSGETLELGYLDRFREINFDLSGAASGGWSAVLEYVSAVDSSGRPTAWRSLPLLANTTAGFTRSGQLTFDPPADWVAASVSPDTPRLFYVRVRTLTAGTAPVARSILGRDYVGAAGTPTGTIPVFDGAADANRNGYLEDSEYANRAAGMEARFAYESRVFTYGPMRFVTNPSDAAFRAWAADYQVRNLAANPLMDGLFIDNSRALPTFAVDAVLEPTATYSADYASLVGVVARAIAPHWLMVNTAGGNASTDATVAQAQSYFEEFSLRAMAHNYVQFEQLAGLVARRAALTSPSGYAVIDSHPQGGTVFDPRMQIGTLAYYYLIGNPETTFLDVVGGYSPGTSWSNHWYPAVTFDVGQPLGTWSVFASGADPAASALSYRVYQREYTNSLILYKPLSFGNNVTGTLSDATATTHQLDGEYYVLKVDGTRGAKVTSVTLRNGEGAILIKA